MRLMSSVWFVLSCAVVQPTLTLAGSLPFTTVFQGGAVFVNLVRQAEQENWQALPLGERTATVGKALRGTPSRT